MVATRQSHQTHLPADFSARLDLLNLSDDKLSYLDRAHALCPSDVNATTLNKAVEMVEILAELNFDPESLAILDLTLH